MSAIKVEPPKKPVKPAPRVPEVLPKVPPPRAPVKAAALVIPRPRGR